MLELATHADRDAVNGLAAQFHAMRISWRPDLYEPARELYPQDRFQQSVAARQLYVAKMADTVVGYCLLRKASVEGPGLVTRKILYIEEFCVHETCRRHGIGTAMAGDILALSRAFGCTDLQLGVYPQNDDAVGFWQKCGFTIRAIEMQRKA